MWAQSYPKFIKKIFLFVYCFFTNILLILCLIPRLSFAIEITQDNIHFIQDFKLMMEFLPIYPLKLITYQSMNA